MMKTKIRSKSKFATGSFSMNNGKSTSMMYGFLKENAWDASAAWFAIVCFVLIN